MNNQTTRLWTTLRYLAVIPLIALSILSILATGCGGGGGGGGGGEGSFTDIFVFGDSLSDTGNAAAFANLQVQSLPTLDPDALCKNVRESGSGPIPCKDVLDLRVGLCFAKFDETSDLDGDGDPDLIFEFPCDDLFFMNSRVSNGPVAVEILAERLGFGGSKPSLFFLPVPPLGTNYAVAGAEAAEFGLGDFNTQIAAFLEDLPFFPESSEALYVIIIGGNDVIKAVKAAADLLKGVDLEPEERPEAIIDAAVNAIGDNINLLIGAGARKFLVANSPNIGSIPAIKIAAEEVGVPPALLRGFATFVTIQFNEQLAARLGQIRAEQQQRGNPVEIKEFNLFRFFEEIRFFEKPFGVFENIKDACFDSGEYRDTGARNFDPDCGVDKFDRFVFFDDLHPTGQVHRIVGEALSTAARKLIDD